MKVPPRSANIFSIPLAFANLTGAQPLKRTMVQHGNAHSQDMICTFGREIRACQMHLRIQSISLGCSRQF
jgi:hypothetical protein